jgi:hypothetical protein
LIYRQLQHLAETDNLPANAEPLLTPARLSVSVCCLSPNFKQIKTFGESPTKRASSG